MSERPLRVAVIGAGMSGVLSAIKLREAGIDDFTVYEKADRLGGTWRENTYPGIACDVPSHLYCYSFALNPEWTHRYSPGAEIQAYFEQVARERDVERYIRFGDAVELMEYGNGRWRLTTESGHRDEVDVVIAATGVLHQPSIPEIDRLDDFAGAVFHSARWDHTVALDGARIGVIGTGSTAIQITSAVVDQAAHFSLFQRTAQWVLPSENPAYTDDEKEHFRSDPLALGELHREISEIFAEGFSNAVVDAESPIMKMIEQACLDNLEQSIVDPELRDRLRPDYVAACKRLIISPDFYQAIQKPNAELVANAIEHIEPSGVRTDDGRLHELDVLVLATGFQVDRFLRPIEVVGRGGVRLDDAWADRPTAYLSISVPEFPNLFMLNGPNGPVGNFSLIEVAELQFAYIMQLVEQLRSGACTAVCPRQEATDAFENRRVAAAQKTVWVTGCNSWYLDDRGIPASWPWPFSRFRDEMAAPDLSAYDLRP
ncbi:MAG: flavin-containing monooxygenase [Acidimicrobiales bacterium]